MIVHKFSLILSFSLCTIMLASDTVDHIPSTLVEKFLEQQSDLRPFYDSLSSEEKVEFEIIVEEVKDIINQAIHDFNTVVENHYDLITKLKEFYNEEQFALTLGFARGSTLKVLNSNSKPTTLQ